MISMKVLPENKEGFAQVSSQAVLSMVNPAHLSRSMINDISAARQNWSAATTSITDPAIVARVLALKETDAVYFAVRIEDTMLIYDFYLQN